MSDGLRAVDRVVEALAEHPAPQPWLVGSACFAPPVEVLAALARLAREPVHDYAPAAGLPALRAALAELHRRAGETVAPDQVLVTAGAKPGLLVTLAGLLEPGDEVLHPTPCYPAYPALARRLGAVPVALTGPASALDAREVAERIGPRTRAIVLSSPANPDGGVLGARAAESLVELCRARGVRLVSDEAYVDFGPEVAAPATFDPGRQVVVQLRSVSKSWALGGWRIGWVVADAPTVRRLAALQSSLLNPPSTPLQAALAVLPEVPPAYLASARAAVRERLERVAAALRPALGAIAAPAGGFYLWAPVGAPDGAEAWCRRLAREAGVGLWPGEDFGAPGWVRVSAVATPPPGWPAAAAELERRLRTARLG